MCRYHERPTTSCYTRSQRHSPCTFLNAITAMLSTAAMLFSRIAVAIPISSSNSRRSTPVASFVPAGTGAGLARGLPRSVSTQQQETTRRRPLLLFDQHQQLLLRLLLSTTPNTRCDYCCRRDATTTATIRAVAQVHGGARDSPASCFGRVRQRRQRGDTARLSVYSQIDEEPEQAVASAVVVGGGVGRDGGEEEGSPWFLGAPAVISFDRVAKRFNQRRWFAAPREVTALEETTLILHGPGPFALVGNSGSGKSTFLRLLCGKHAASEGCISMGAPAGYGNPNAGATWTAARLDTTRRRLATDVSDGPSTSVGGGGSCSGESPSKVPPPGRVAYIDRSSTGDVADMRHLTVTQGVSGVLGSRCASAYSDDGSVALGLLNAAGLSAARDKRCGDLSRGQMLRLVLCIGVARAMAGRPVVGSCDDEAPTEEPDCASLGAPGPVLCLDEFLEFEDARVRRGVEDACAGLCNAGVTIVFATHVMEHVDGMMASSTAPSSLREKLEGRDIIAADDTAGGKWGGSGGVLAFCNGRVAEVSLAKTCTYVTWKKEEAADRRGRKII